MPNLPMEKSKRDSVTSVAPRLRNGICRTRLGTLSVGLASAFLLISELSFAASFDCQLASNSAEKLVCSTPVRSRLEEDLSRSYVQTLESHRTPSQIRHEQLTWLREARNHCSDPACLENAYRSRIAVLERTSDRQQNRAKERISGSRKPSPLRTLHFTEEFGPTDYRIIKRSERIIFSQFDHSGNRFDVVAFNLSTLAVERVARGIRGGHYVAESDKYLVIGKKEGIVRPLLVIDRATGKVIKQIKLKRPVTWAKIEGDRLIAIQGGFSLGTRYTATCEALIFELPSLKIIKRTKITGGNDVQTWKGLILSLGYDLAAYDESLNEVFKITLPERKRGERYSCAPTGPLRVYRDIAVVVGNCGDIWTLDLAKGVLAHTIPSYSMFYAVAIVDGLLFTAPRGNPPQRDSARVFELLTGQELAKLPINATDLFAEGNRLLAVQRNFAKPSPMTVFAVDAAALRDGDWREQEVLSECKKAQAVLAASKDIYAAIDICEASGIEGVFEGGNAPTMLLPVAEEYAVWLSETLDLAHRAIPLLEALIEVRRTERLERALANAKLKARVLAGQAPGTLSESERDTGFGRILEDGKQWTAPETMDIFYGAFSNLFHFSGDRVYVGRYANGASVGVLERATLREIADIPIAPDDDTYQDHVESIATDEAQIYVRVGYRYEAPGRPNLFVVDKASLQVLQKAHVPAPSSLIMDGDRLLACGCHFTRGHRCLAINTTTFETQDVLGKICIQNEQGNEALVASDALIAGAARYAVETKDFLIARERWKGDTRHVVYPKEGGDSRTIEYDASDALSWPKSIEGNNVVIAEATPDGMRIKEVDASTGSVRTLLGVPTDKFRGPVIADSNGILFVGLGRDLIVYDLSLQAVSRYIKDYIVAAPNQASNIDAHAIARLIVDEGRLIALTARGENSRVTRLEKLAKRGK